MQSPLLKTMGYLMSKPLRYVPKAARLSPGRARAGLAPGRAGGAQEVDSLPIPPRISSQHQLQLISNQVGVTCQEKLRKIINAHKHIIQVS